MARIIRMIWRLDYEPSYAYLDNRGSALKILKEEIEDFWEIVADGSVQLSFVGRAPGTDSSRQISVEPTSLNGSMDWPGGLEISRVLEHPDFRKLDRLIKALLHNAEVRILKRAGLRLFSVAEFDRKGSDALRTVSNLVGAELRAAVSDKVGEIKDLAFIFEGKGSDDLGFRVQFGPYDKKNPELIFQRPLTDEEYERNRASPISAQIVNLPHHGSRIDCPPSVITQLFGAGHHKRIGITSANGLTHPSPETIQFLEKSGIKPYCTNLMPMCGANAQRLLTLAGLEPRLARWVREVSRNHGSVQICQGDITVTIQDDGTFDVSPEVKNDCAFRGDFAALMP